MVEFLFTANNIPDKGEIPRPCGTLEESNEKAKTVDLIGHEYRDFRLSCIEGSYT